MIPLGLVFLGSRPKTFHKYFVNTAHHEITRDRFFSNLVRAGLYHNNIYAELALWSRWGSLEKRLQKNERGKKGVSALFRHDRGHM